MNDRSPPAVATTEGVDAFVTVRDVLRHAVGRFNAAGLAFGHGSVDAWDEAVYLILQHLHLPLDRLDPFLEARLTGDERDALVALVARRVDERIPAAYLTGEAWLGDYRFAVDPRVIVPRSYIAELLFERLAPWIAEADAVDAVLDLCTGSGCLAIIAADAFPHAVVDAADLSSDALAVARINVDAYGLDERVRLVPSDLFDALPFRRYDLIISNPPYVNDASMAMLPDEYRREPRMALAGGADGLDLVRRILAQAPDRLAESGLLVIEVGHERRHVEAAFPDLACTWLSTSGGDDAVFAITAADLRSMPVVGRGGAMIRWTALSLRRGVKLLLEDVSAVVNPGEKVGLVGANGSGKSTLFALLRGELQPDQGDLSIPGAWRIAHVAQETAATENSALEFVIDGDKPLRAVEAAMAAMTVPTGTPSSDSDDHALAELHMAYGDAGGYTAASRGEALLLGLGFTLAQAQQPVVTFSGGWRMRLQLAQALMAPSDLLLLDEPTNHLDLDAIVWLEQWLRRYEGTLVIISHDREFLDAVCNVTLSLEQKKLTRWSGNYTAFELQRAERMRLAQGAFGKQQREIAHLQSFVDRFKAKASKAKQAQSRVKAMERMTLLAPVIEASPFTFKFRAPVSSPDPMLILEDVDCGYAGPTSRTVVRDVDLRLTAGERIGLLGANGQGKSTVVKTIAGTLERIGGTMTAGKGLAIGYFAQHQIDMLDMDASPLLQLHRVAVAGRPNAAAPREQELRDYLGGFDFRGEMATASVAPFSGGEKARLALALIIWNRPNLLLLDEPTNHLDLETREALTLALAQFEGALILVSHDRALLRATTDRFLLVDAGRCSEYDGDLDDYRNWSLKKSSGDGVAKTTAVDAPPSKATLAKTPPANAPVPEPKSREQRRHDAASREAAARQRKPIEQRIRRIESRLAEAEAARKAIDVALAAPGVYEDGQRERLKQLLIDQAYRVRDIEQLEAEWLEQQALLEQPA